MALVLASLLGVAAITVGATAASADDPLAVQVPNPGGVTPAERISLPRATNMNPYSFQMVATGGQAPYTWAIDPSGSPWNVGLTISPSGLISGTPVIADNGSNYISAPAVRVTDSASPPATAVLLTDLKVQPYVRIANSLPNGVAGEPYSAALDLRGGVLPMKATKGSALPKGMKLAKNVLSGTPRFGGTYLLAFNLQDSAVNTHYASQALSLTIAGPSGPSGGTGGKGKPAPFAAFGDVGCTGGVTLKTASSGAPPSAAIVTQIKGTLGCSGGTGDSRVTIRSAKVLGSYFHSGSCSVLGVSSATNSSFGSLEISWKTAGGSIFTTTVAFTNHEATATGWQLPAPGTGGVSTVTGSYAGHGSANAALQSSTPLQMQNTCGGPPDKLTTTGTLFLNL